MIKAYKPALDELSFRESLMADPETMSYNDAWGGTIPFPKEDWKDWYEYWMDAPESEMYYRYLYDDAAGCFVGEIAYHYDEDRNIHICDVIVLAKYRGRGYGSAGNKPALPRQQRKMALPSCMTILPRTILPGSCS
jgi:Acetyltransferase (GNAT) family.